MNDSEWPDEPRPVPIRQRLRRSRDRERERQQDSEREFDLAAVLSFRDLDTDRLHAYAHAIQEVAPLVMTTIENTAQNQEIDSEVVDEAKQTMIAVLRALRRVANNDDFEAKRGAADQFRRDEQAAD